MDKRILATYFHGTGFGYDWLQDDEEVKEWLNENNISELSEKQMKERLEKEFNEKR